MGHSKLPRSTPGMQGVSAEGINKFLNAIEQDGKEKIAQELHSFMLIRHGYVVAEGWWKPYDKELTHMLFSLSKSFTSTAVGMAANEGILDVEELVIDNFKEDLPLIVPDNLAKMKIKHLLSMSTGHGEDTMEAVVTQPEGDWVKGFFSKTVKYEPGTHFLYNTGATYMLSAIIQKKTGMQLINYLRPRLFEPLGIEDAVWETCPRGINTGGFGLNIKTEDIGKFGQLYLQKGVWNGKRLIEEKWIEEATKKQINNDNEDNKLGDWGQGYCYQFWRCRNNAYRGDGAFGQYCLVMPEQDAVIAITGGAGDMQLPLNHIFDFILPAMLDNKIDNPGEDEKLQRRLKELSICKKGDELEKSAFKANFGAYKLEKNIMEFNEFSLGEEMAKEHYVIKFSGEKGELKLSCGRTAWIENIVETRELLEGFPGKPGYPSRIAAIASSPDKASLVITMRFIETPFYETGRLKFDKGSVTIEMKLNLGFENPEPILIQGSIIK